MKPVWLTARRITLALLCLGMAGPSPGAEVADADIADMKRAITELRAQNRALADRVDALEAEKSAHNKSPVLAPSNASTAAAPPATTDDLARRIGELEFTKIAQEDATRAIIRDSLEIGRASCRERVSVLV